MAKYFQVVRTDFCGRVTGEIFSDPRKAIERFIHDSRQGSTYPDIIFRAIDSPVVTMATDKITMVFLEKINKFREWDVTFSCEDPAGLNLASRKISEGHGGIYFSDTVVYNYKTGDIIAELHQ